MSDDHPVLVQRFWDHIKYERNKELFNKYDLNEELDEKLKNQNTLII
jgi:hypothetical protein